MISQVHVMGDLMIRRPGNEGETVSRLSRSLSHDPARIRLSFISLEPGGWLWVAWPRSVNPGKVYRVIRLDD